MKENLKKLFDFEENRSAQPFVKWVGGKRKLAERLAELIPENFNNYFEPFIGGGALFFYLYSSSYFNNRKSVIIDINSELINTYKVVKNKPNELIRQLNIYKNNHNKEFYYKIREIDRLPEYKKLDEVLRAARFIYLNKTCFNGLYRVNRAGYFNVPMGSYKKPNIVDEDAIQNASLALSNTEIYNDSYNLVESISEKGDFVYFDPPYYPLNKTSNFTSYSESNFLEKEQVLLSTLFKKLSEKGVFVLLSNSDTEFIRDLYKDYEIITVSMGRSINSNALKRGKVNEIVVKGW